jgi:hypothetical protein
MVHIHIFFLISSPFFVSKNLEMLYLYTVGKKSVVREDKTRRGCTDSQQRKIVGAKL